MLRHALAFGAALVALFIDANCFGDGERDERRPTARAAATGAAGSIDSVVDRAARAASSNGDAILPHRLEPSRPPEPAALAAARGKVTHRIRLGGTDPLGALLAAGNRVDVMVVTRDDARPLSRVAKLFITNVRVLEIESARSESTGDRAISRRLVSLEVTPDEARRLGTAEREGDLQLVLRGAGDTDSVVTTGAMAVDVLSEVRRGGAEPRAP